jgi:thiosulfate/3-mercaptopyruvate sulfurtransferase
MRYLFADCRWALDDPGLGWREYSAGHIPGAVFVDVEGALSGPAGVEGRHPLPAEEDFARSMGELGIGNDVFVVAYGSLGGAERLWWLLRHFGHDGCAVIELESWRGPLTSGIETPEAAVFSPLAQSGDTIGRGELVVRLGELVVIDSRMPSRYRGEANPIDRVRGRIPGALNAPWPEELPELPSGELVAYCGSGVTACVSLHRLHLAGREGRLYPGSWSEWEQHAELPVERDDS